MEAIGLADSTIRNRFFATWDEASRVSKVVCTTLNRIRIVATAEPPPIDDGWEVVGDDYFANNERPINPKTECEPQAESKLNSPKSAAGEYGIRETFRNFRKLEGELRDAVARGNDTLEKSLRSQLSHCRQQLSEDEKNGDSWTTATMYGGIETPSTPSIQQSGENKIRSKLPSQ